MLAEANSEEARQAELFRGVMELCDTEKAAPSAGLKIHTEKLISAGSPGDTAVFKKVLTDRADELSGLATQARAA